eukprot:c7420_g1_i1 orf=3-164(-)
MDYPTKLGVAPRESHFVHSHSRDHKGRIDLLITSCKDKRQAPHSQHQSRSSAGS